jgi:hypothetical protein
VLACGWRLRVRKYAKVFIDRPDGTLGVVHEMQVAVGARRSSVTIAGSDVEVEIRRNREVGDAPGFLGFPLYAEVHPNDGCSDREFIAAVASLVAALDAAGFEYVTAADFEDRLPNQGRNVPIP